MTKVHKLEPRHYRGTLGEAGTYTVALGASKWPAQKVGGKADGLRRAIYEGFLVPEGFCLTTRAFDEVTNRIIGRTDDLAEVQELLESVTLPRAIRDEIAARIDDIGAVKWAVRSSAIGEDSPVMSLAGQQISVLGLEGIEAVLAAVAKVWASAFGAEALAYRTHMDPNGLPPSMAVVIQAMLDPVASGVLFTRNPVTDNAKEAVVCASPGLGTPVVDGDQCDTFYIERPSGYVRRRVLGLGPEKRSLDDERLRELGERADRIEVAFGTPLDVEWAFVEENDRLRFYILQVRHIVGRKGSSAHRETVWTNTNVGEALPGVATPLTWSVIRRFSRRGFDRAFASLGLDVPEDHALVGAFHGRIFINVTEFLEIACAVPFLTPEILLRMAGGGAADFVDGTVTQASSKNFIRRLPQTVTRVLASQLALPLLTPIWENYFEDRKHRFFATDLSRMNRKAFLETFDRVSRLFERTGLVMLGCSSNFLVSHVITKEALRILGAPPALRRDEDLLGGLAVSSGKPGLALLELGHRVRRSRRLRRIIRETAPNKAFAVLQTQDRFSDVSEFLTDLEVFRREFGHRAPREAELATPRWREDTTFVFQVLRGYVEAPQIPRLVELREEHAAMGRERQMLISSSFSKGIQPIVRGMLHYTRANAARREAMRSRVVDALDMLRKLFLECGRRMERAGVIKETEDAFFLTYEEIISWLRAPTQENYFLRVAVRRAQHALLQGLPEPPSTFLARGPEILAGEEQPKATAFLEPSSDHLIIKGIPTSGGRITGRARIMLDPAQDATLLPGEVLVAPYADIGWTPLFLTASALVVSLGGPLSHAAIVAREYGLPTVVNARGATAVIKTGDIVTVDGDLGRVYVSQTSTAESADE